MTNNHSQSFFGQTTGLIISSSSKSEPYIFIKCIKKKENGEWEKPSSGEGKTIKVSLDEMVMILKVLKRKIESWSGFHSYKENKTQISLNWEKNGENKFWIKIGEYSKLLGEAQIEILKLLMKHLIKEKIEFATVSNTSKLEKNGPNTTKAQTEVKVEKVDMNINTVKQSVPEGKNIIEVQGSIKAETEKALFIVFNSGQEVWIPKSSIHSKFKPEKGINQKFLVEEWVLKRNNINLS
ncbi:MAG: hypothetical protein EU529_14770 [Promethearchaeota archaeon]|nr:MAG: hypothetical protein EU529_14770 [Candidatus Lokiarchaeota archaeon]